MFYADSNKNSCGKELKYGVQAAQSGYHGRIILQDKNDKVGKDRSKQPLCPEAAQIHTQMFAKDTQ